MPALTPRAQIGTHAKSDGTPIASLDWLANMAVDRMAKDAAHSVRTSEDVRSKLEAAWQNVSLAR